MRESIGLEVPLDVIEGGIGRCPVLADNWVAYFLPGEAVIVRALHVNECGLERIVVRDVDVSALGGDPGPVAVGRADDLPRAAADAESAG